MAELGMRIGRCRVTPVIPCGIELMWSSAEISSNPKQVTRNIGFGEGFDSVSDIVARRGACGLARWGYVSRLGLERND